jgi:hypothetical protein
VRIDSYQRITFRLVATVQFDARYIAEEVQMAVEAGLADAFSFAQREFGQPVTAAEIIRVIHEVEGVIAVDLDALYSVGDAGRSLVVIAKLALRNRLGKVAGLTGVRPPVVKLAASPASTQSTLASFLPAHIARWVDGEVQLAQLLVIDETGIELTMKANR